MIFAYITSPAAQWLAVLLTVVAAIFIYTRFPKTVAFPQRTL